MAIKTKSDLYPLNDFSRLSLIDSAFEHIKQKVWPPFNDLMHECFYAKYIFKEEVDEKASKASNEKLKEKLRFVDETFFKNSEACLATEKRSYADILLGAVCLFYTIVGEAFPQFDIDLGAFPKIQKFYKKLGKAEHGKRVIAMVREDFKKMSKGKT